MRKLKTLTLLFVMMLALSFTFVGCSPMGGKNWAPGPMGGTALDQNQADASAPNYEYNKVYESPFFNTAEQNESFFSLDRNTASYSYVRRQLQNNYTIQSDSIRTEELVNYFDYGYPAPTGDEVVNATTYLSNCPWNEKTKLLTVGIKTKEVQVESLQNNFVFLIDVSGSMHGSDRLELVKYGVNKLIDGLSSKDRVSIVTYASGVGVRLESTLLDENGKREVKRVVNELDANGSTNGSGGIEKAYEIAARQKAEGVNSRVILMTDGDFNVGISSETKLKEYIKEQAKSGVYLSVLGYGMGNTRDDILETLARNGNGNYAYIDSEIESDKVFSKELNGVLVTVMKDAKAGVTFTDGVKKYRLLGYDTKHITEDDFNNNEKDTGEIGSNLTVTVMYEVELADTAEADQELASVEIRYKNALASDEPQSTVVKVMNTLSDDDNIAFAACVAEFGLVLRDSKYKENASLQNVLERLQALKAYTDGDAYKQEFARLVAQASEIYKETTTSTQSSQQLRPEQYY